MPVKPGPDPIDGEEPATYWPHSSEGNDEVLILRRIREELEPRAKRWEGIKLLRIMRLNEPNAVTSRRYLNSFPAARYDALRDGRLSGVATALGIDEIAGDRIHLDLDWFGAPGLNWWGGAIDGRAWEFVVAGALLNYLEWSMQVIRSRPDPSSWRWHDPSSDDPFDDLELQQLDPAKQIEPLVINWNAERGGREFRVLQRDGILEITTPTPPTLIAMTMR